MRSKKNIVLCGFMGCGKSTIGKMIAKIAQLKFIDLDDYIEEKENRKIKDIFAQEGEEYFRDLEYKATQEISQMTNTVISAGGGTLTFDRNVEALRENNIIIYIDVTLNNIKTRLKNDTTRPLLQKPNKDEVMQELYNKRIPLYKDASNFIVNGNKSPKFVSEEIYKIYKEVNKIK